MTDADLIYNALLRAEKRLEADLALKHTVQTLLMMSASFAAVRVIREEIGNGLAAEGR